MKTRAFMLISGLVSLLLLGGCSTTKPGAGAMSPNEARAEISLAESQKEKIIRNNLTAINANALFENGDKIAVQIWLKDKVTQLSGFPLELEVGASGQLFMPHVGMVQVAGKTVRAIQAELQASLSQTLKDVTVIVARKGEKTIGGIGPDGKASVSVELGKHFVVMGHINRPGLYPLEAGLRVRDAIAIAGGLEHYGHPRIYLVRGKREQPEIKRINLDDIFYGENLDDNILLTSNDAIYVAPKMLYTIADFITLLLSPVTSIRDALWVYDRVVLEQE